MSEPLEMLGDLRRNKSVLATACRGSVAALRATSPQGTRGDQTASCRLCGCDLVTTYDASHTLLIRLPEGGDWEVHCPGCGVRTSEREVAG